MMAELEHQNCSHLTFGDLENWTSVMFNDTENWTNVMFNDTDNWTKSDYCDEQHDGINTTDVITRVNMPRAVLFLSCVPVAAAGFGANLLNMAVFWRQGFRESVNVSLFCLAISDLVNVVSIIIFVLTDADIIFDLDIAPPELWFISSWLHYGLSLCSCCTAIFISIERCLCIVLPFRVKDIVTPRRSVVIFAAIFVSSLSVVCPVISIVNLMWERDPCTRKMIKNIYFVNKRPLLYLVSNLGYTILQTTSFIVLLFATATLILALKRNSKWRQRMMVQGPHTVSITNSKSKRDQRVVKMVVIVSSVLLVCHGPAQAIPFASMCVPELQHGRRYDYEFGVSWAVGHFLYAVNSSVNLIIYYKMSSKFRNTLNAMCR